MNSEDLGFRRLFNQHIDGSRCQTPEEVVRWMGAMQAQDYAQSVWGIGCRTQSATLSDVQQAIADKQIVRTWAMRGTLHFVPPGDVRWMQKLLAPRLLAGQKRRWEQLELDEKTIERSKNLFHDALQGGKRLTRPAMMTLLENAGVSPRGQRGYHILWNVAQAGLICLGPLEGKQQTFVLLEEWIAGSRELSREESLAELARQYFTSHGPATLHDFAWWVGLPVGDARAGLEAVKSTLISERTDSKEYWMSQDSAAPTAHDSANAHLLPGFDEYLLGYKDRSDVLGAEHAAKVFPGSNGMFLPFIVVASPVVGTWRRTLKKNALDLTISAFVTGGVARESVARAAKRYADFIGLPLSSIEVRDA